VVARGEVWWYEATEVHRRPWLVIARDEAIPVLNQVLAVPATRNIRGIPTEVELDHSDGMPTRCALTLDNVATIRPSLCTRRITRLSPERMVEVCQALLAATAC
jgi:mRNA interferase MazF